MSYPSEDGYGLGLGTVSHVSGTGWIRRLGNDAQYLLWPSNVTSIADDGFGFVYAMDPATVTIWEISPRKGQPSAPWPAEAHGWA